MFSCSKENKCYTCVRASGVIYNSPAESHTICEDDFENSSQLEDGKAAYDFRRYTCKLD